MTKNRVLVIEDEVDILEAVSYNLKREGFEVISAENGSMGLFLIQREKPDVVLLDLMLPGTDGFQICRSIKSDEQLKNILVIMVSAKGEENDVVLGLQAGADIYVSKPFSIRELMARVKAVLRRDESKADPAVAGPIQEQRKFDQDQQPYVCASF